MAYAEEQEEEAAVSGLSFKGWLYLSSAISAGLAGAWLLAALLIIAIF